VWVSCTPHELDARAHSTVSQQRRHTHTHARTRTHTHTHTRTYTHTHTHTHPDAGGSHEGYIKWACMAAASRGWRCVVLNMRGCNGLPLTSARGYNAINTADVHLAVQSINRCVCVCVCVCCCWCALLVPCTRAARAGAEQRASRLSPTSYHPSASTHPQTTHPPPPTNRPTPRPPAAASRSRRSWPRATAWAACCWPSTWRRQTTGCTCTRASASTLPQRARQQTRPAGLLRALARRQAAAAPQARAAAAAACRS
jgi:hypothetical protein